MLRALKNPTSNDKRALAVFFGIALLCAVYFSSGILVSYVSPPADFVEMSKDGTGFMVQVSNIPSFEAALQLSNALREQRRLQSHIDVSPTGFGYLLLIGPIAKKEMAETLAGELKTSGYDHMAIVESCPAGQNCPRPVSSEPATNANGTNGAIGKTGWSTTGKTQ